MDALIAGVDAPTVDYRKKGGTVLLDCWRHVIGVVSSSTRKLALVCKHGKTRCTQPGPLQPACCVSGGGGAGWALGVAAFSAGAASTGAGGGGCLLLLASSLADDASVPPLPSWACNLVIL